MLQPITQRPYTLNNNFVKKKEDEENSQNALETRMESQRDKLNSNTNRAAKQLTSYENEKNSQTDEEKLKQPVSNEINIAQILKDFRSTALAIGTPAELNQEVEGYLGLVETQVQKEDPNVKIIKSNLKNASSILDAYITKTLEKKSQVVENWIDALFLQKINYSYDEDDVNKHFLVKFPGETSSAETSEETETVESEQEQTSSSTPADEELKTLFLEGKKYASANENKKSMEYFQKALSRAIDVNDSETESKVLFEMGKIYDKNDYLAHALTSFNKSIAATSDKNIKTQAHYSMAQIYDDINQFETAIGHYYNSIGYAGELDNLKVQAKSLTKIANIYSDKYNKEAFEYYDQAKSLASQTDSLKAQGYVSANTANAYNKFNKPKEALNYYSDAVKSYTSADSPLNTALNYKRAGEVMEDYGNSAKAKSLYQKALLYARKTDNVSLMREINAQLQGA